MRPSEAVLRARRIPFGSQVGKLRTEKLPLIAKSSRAKKDERTQEEVAIAGRWDRSFLVEVEHGKVTAQIDRLEDFAAGLRVDIPDLFEYQPRSHTRIADELRADIRSGKLKPGDVLPDVSTLALRHKNEPEYRVSSISLENALIILRGDRLVRTKNDGATYVVDENDLEPVLIDGTCWISCRRPTLKEIEMFGLHAGVHMLTCKRRLDGPEEAFPSDRCVFVHPGGDVAESQASKGGSID